MYFQHEIQGCSNNLFMMVLNNKEFEPIYAYADSQWTDTLATQCASGQNESMTDTMNWTDGHANS